MKDWVWDKEQMILRSKLHMKNLRRNIPHKITLEMSLQETNSKKLKKLIQFFQTQILDRFMANMEKMCFEDLWKGNKT